jgi:hypothetical protein
MEYIQFDRLVRALTEDSSRRSVLRRAAKSAMVGPISLLGFDAALADGKDKDKGKDKNKEKDKGKDKNQVNVNASGGTATADSSGGQANQTVVQTNNQVCAGNCAQTNVQSSAVNTTQSVLVEQDFFGRPPSYWIDVACTFDAPLYRTVCDCVAHGEAGAPTVRKIALAPADICAYVISEETGLVSEQAPITVNADTNAEANAGNGGVANAVASGGSVTIGDVSGSDTSIAIDASGGTASADASGGDNNIAIAGGNQISSQASQAVELNVLTLTLEGNVVPGKLTTYWVDTDAGRRPATGPALVQIPDEAEDVGTIIAEARICDLAQPQQGYDWFGQCASPAVDMQFSLYPAGGDAGPISTQATNAQGRAHFGALAPGMYHLQPDSASWCYAESDRVDANGDVIVESGVESHVWSFVCGGVGGS